MKKSVGVLVGVLMALMFASSANAAVLLQQTMSNSSPPISQVDNRTGWIGQSIKESQGVNNLKKITLKIGCSECPGSGMSVYVMTSSNPNGGGYPSGIILASAFAPNSAIPPPSANYTFVLDSVVNLAADTEYWIVVEGYRVAPPAHHLAAWYQGSGGTAYPNGLVRWRYWDGMTWAGSYIPSDTDLYFILESEDGPPPPPPPANLSLRLPFKDGESWTLTRGYNTPDTHTDTANSYYALDFDKNGLVEDQEPGEPVLAPASGKVTLAGLNLNGGFGYSVKINAGNGYEILLAHLRHLPSVKVGQYVFQGEQVGIMGGTGTGGIKVYNDHIHMQVYYNGNCKSTVPESNPEPMFGNPNFTAGQMYTSSNTTPNAIYHLDTTFDSSGNGNNATVNPSCAVAGCLNLNGTNNYLEAPDSPSLSITGVNLSIAGWLKTSSLATQWLVSKYNNGASDASYGLYLSNGYVRFTVSPNGSAGGEVQSTVGVNDGNRRHVVVTYDGMELRIYIDGAVNTWQSYFITNIFDSSSPLRIGAKNSQTAMEFFSEMLDEIAIYGRTLTADEVNNMYYSSKP